MTEVWIDVEEWKKRRVGIWKGRVDKYPGVDFFLFTY